MNLVPQFRPKARETLPHVEVRQCDLGFLQLNAWSAGGMQPALVVPTYRSTVSRLLVSGNLFVFILAGGTYDVLVVIRYKAGTPDVAFSDSTKGDISIQSDWNVLSITIKEEGKPATKHDFRENLDDLGIR